jgi:hypothetical protein
VEIYTKLPNLFQEITNKTVERRMPGLLYLYSSIFTKIPLIILIEGFFEITLEGR